MDPTHPADNDDEFAVGNQPPPEGESAQPADGPADGPADPPPPVGVNFRFGEEASPAEDDGPAEGDPSGADENVDPEYKMQELQLELGRKRSLVTKTLQVKGKDDHKQFRRGTDLAVAGDDRVGQLRRQMQLPLTFVIGRIRHSVDSSALYMDMLIFIPFLVLFVFFFLAGRPVESNYYILKGVRDRAFLTEFPPVETQLDTYRQQVLNKERLWVEQDKRYDDIGNGEDWLDWLSTAVVPNIFDCATPNRSHRLLAPLGQNIHVGSLRIRTQRVRNESCTVDEAIYPNETLFPRTCYASSSSKHELKSVDTMPACNITNPMTGSPLWNYVKCSDHPGIPIRAVEGIYHCGGFTIDIPFENTTCNDARAVVEAMSSTEACQFVNNWDTRFVSVEYFMYTPSTDTFHSVKLFSEVTVPGWWFNQWVIRSFSVWTTEKIAQTVVDFLFLAYVSFYWFFLFFSGYKHWREGHGILSFVTEFWNVVEFLNLLTFMVVFVFRWIWWAKSIAADNIKIPVAPGYPENLDQLQVLYEAQVYGNSINTLIVFLKLLKYVRLNPRLNVLTRTIAACQQSILGVLVLFITIILGYAITGWTLFGINVAGFRDLGVSISSLVRMLVGDINYEELRAENRFLSGVFFWTYIVIVQFLLLNFLIAIISESFAQVSGKAYSTPFEEFVLRWWQSLRAFMRPENLRRIFRNLKDWRFESTLLRQVLRCLESALEKKKEELAVERRLEREQRRAEAEDWDDADVDEDGADDAEIVMRFPDLEVLVDEETYAALGTIFFEYTWEDLMNEFDDAKKTLEEVGRRRTADTVKQGVEKVLADDIEKIKQLDETLSSVEAEVQGMLDALDPSRKLPGHNVPVALAAAEEEVSGPLEGTATFASGAFGGLTRSMEGEGALTSLDPAAGLGLGAADE